jgi:hypothetical protein
LPMFAAMRRASSTYPFFNGEPPRSEADKKDAG